MNESEARLILERELARYRGLSYAELLSLVGHIETCERASLSGATYQIEIEVFFDDKARRTIRVLGGIDDGGLRAFIPLTDDFTRAPDDTSIGE